MCGVAVTHTRHGTAHAHIPVLLYRPTGHDVPSTEMESLVQ